MSFTKTSLISELTATVQDVAVTLGNNFDPVLEASLAHFTQKRPRTAIAEITLVAGEEIYDAPADLVAYKCSQWGYSQRRTKRPWDEEYPRRLPRVSESGDGKLVFMPAPKPHQVSFYGSKFRFFYFAKHVVSETSADTTVPESDKALLLLRMQAETMRHLALKKVNQASVRGASSAQPKIGHPTYLFKELMQEFEERAG